MFYFYKNQIFGFNFFVFNELPIVSALPKLF